VKIVRKVSLEARECLHISPHIEVDSRNPIERVVIERDGGLGSDEVVYSGPRSRYSLLKNSDGSTTVTDSAPGGDGSDTLTGYYTLRFTDALVEVGPGPHPPASGSPGSTPVVKRK
jgi:hypothetical protein